MWSHRTLYISSIHDSLKWSLIRRMRYITHIWQHNWERCRERRIILKKQTGIRHNLRQRKEERSLLGCWSWQGRRGIRSGRPRVKLSLSLFLQLAQISENRGVFAAPSSPLGLLRSPSFRHPLSTHTNSRFVFPARTLPNLTSQAAVGENSACPHRFFYNSFRC